MRRASRMRTALAQTTSSTPSAPASLTASSCSAESVHSASAMQDHGYDGKPQDSGPNVREVRLSPAGTFVSNEPGAAELGELSARQRQLAIAIRQRIESRLAGRVRELSVRIIGNKIVLEGKCSTYYTKQLAQHAVLGVLEDEQLDNAIVVEVPR
jgi:hypothetical protein